MWKRASGLLLLWVWLYPGLLRADHGERPDGSTVNGRFTIEESNDSLTLFGGSDNLFTQSLRLRWTWDPKWKSSWLYRYVYRPFRKSMRPNRINGSFVIGQDIYTPEDISPFREADELDEGEAGLTVAEKEAEFDEWYFGDFVGDRPYSSEIFAQYEVTGHFASNNVDGFPRWVRPLLQPFWGEVGNVRWTSAVRVAYVGPKYAGQVQKGVHVLMRGLDQDTEPRDPQGWSFEQQQNRFSYVRATETADVAAFNASFEIESDLVNVGRGRHWGPHLRVAWLSNLELGTIRDLGGLGARVEIGRLGMDPLSCHPAGQPQQVWPNCTVTDGPAVGGDTSMWAGYLFTEARGRLSVYDRHLDNCMFEDCRIQADRRHWDADWRFGLALRLVTFELEYSHIIRVKQIQRVERGRFHHMGTFKLSALF